MFEAGQTSSVIADGLEPVPLPKASPLWSSAVFLVSAEPSSLIVFIWIVLRRNPHPTRCDTSPALAGKRTGFARRFRSSTPGDRLISLRIADQHVHGPVHPLLTVFRSWSRATAKYSATKGLVVQSMQRVGSPWCCASATGSHALAAGMDVGHHVIAKRVHQVAFQFSARR